MRHLLAVILLLVATAVTALGAPPRWETLNAPPHGVAVASQRLDAEGVDVSVHDGCIYVGCQRPQTVKVFTVLGQLISEGQLQPGVHRLRISAKGIYILKTASATRRVTL